MAKEVQCSVLYARNVSAPAMFSVVVDEIEGRRAGGRILRTNLAGACFSSAVKTASRRPFAFSRKVRAGWRDCRKLLSALLVVLRRRANDGVASDCQPSSTPRIVSRVDRSNDGVAGQRNDPPPTIFIGIEKRDGRSAIVAL
jgi:hypothetical protein